MWEYLLWMCLFLLIVYLKLIKPTTVIDRDVLPVKSESLVHKLKSSKISTKKSE